MARKYKSKSVYIRIEEKKSEIISAEQHLAQLKSQLEELLVEKDDYEMRETWKAIKEKGISVEDIQKLLVQ